VATRSITPSRNAVSELVPKQVGVCGWNSAPRLPARSDTDGLGCRGMLRLRRRCRSHRVRLSASRCLLPVGREVSAEAQSTRSVTRLDDPLVPVNLVATRAHGCTGDADVALGCHPLPFLRVPVPEERSRAVRRWWSLLTFHETSPPPACPVRQVPGIYHRVTCQGDTPRAKPLVWRCARRSPVRPDR